MARGSRCPQGPYVYWLSPLSQATNSSLWNQKPISRDAVSTESLACTTFLRRDGDVTSKPGATPNSPPPMRPYLLTCMLRSPRMVPAAACAESVSPTMARVERTTL